MNWDIIVISLPGSGCDYRLLHELRAMEKFHMTEFERSVADYLFALAEKEGRQVMASFKNADYIVGAETVGHECGVTRLTRDLLQRYPFVQTR